MCNFAKLPYSQYSQQRLPPPGEFERSRMFAINQMEFKKCGIQHIASFFHLVKATLCLVLVTIGITQADLASEISALTGNTHTRVVWLQGGLRIDGGGAVMGYDSKENKTTQILPAATKQNRPILCSGGYRVVVSINYKVYVVDWDGTNKRYIADGFSSDVWLDTKTGLEWVIARSGGKSTGGDVYRYQLDDPTKKIKLWDKGSVGIDYMPWWQVSADGTMGAEFMPWPNGYLIEDGVNSLNPKTTKMTDGCWSSVASDNSKYWFNLTCCPHHEILVYNQKTSIAKFGINAGPLPAGTQNNEYYHPKFASNGGRFLTVSGGYHGNSDSKDAEVYLGKFASNYKSFEGWVRITNNNQMSDYTPDAWIGVSASGPPKPEPVELVPSLIEFDMENALFAINTNQSIKATVLDQFSKALSPQPKVSWAIIGSGASIDADGLFKAGNTVGKYTVMASVGPLKSQLSVEVFDPAKLWLRINSGASSSAVNGWESDAAYLVAGSESQPYDFRSKPSISGVTNAAPADVYQTVRHGDHSYSFKQITNGTYKVRLHFYDVATDGRNMEYQIEGKSVLSNFSIIKTAGAGKALVREFDVIVSDGNGMQIVAKKGSGDDVFQSGIEIIAASATEPNPTELTQIVIKEPATSSNFKVGDGLTIKWDAPKEVSGVTLEISLDGGQNWNFITEGSITRTSAQWGSYAWTLPASINLKSTISNTVYLKIADYFDAGTYYALSEKNSITGTSAIHSLKQGAALDWEARVQGQNLVIQLGPAHDSRIWVVDNSGKNILEKQSLSGTIAISTTSWSTGQYWIFVSNGKEVSQTSIMLLH